MPKMSRQQTFIHLLFVWLLLVASLLHFSIHTNVQAIESAHFKLKPSQPSSRSRRANVRPSWIDGKNIHKTPSGPNPVGNHSPPTKQ